MTPFSWGLFIGTLFTGVFIGALIVTAFVVSGTIARNEERLHWGVSVVPDDEQEDARITAAEEALKEMERKADFYYGMVTDEK